MRIYLIELSGTVLPTFSPGCTKPRLLLMLLAAAYFADLLQ